MQYLENIANALRTQLELESNLKNQRDNMLQSESFQSIPVVMQDEIDRNLERTIESCRRGFQMIIEDLLKHPPWSERHKGKLQEFHRNNLYENSILIMTKFPSDQDTQLDQQLARVIDAVKAAIIESGFTPLIASDRHYHPMLWDNVELYLLGCGKGIAIVENRYNKQINPNVAIEWGVMRGLGKDVLFLLEEGFKVESADWQGFLKSSFAWRNPEPGISKAIKSWLRPDNPKKPDTPANSSKSRQRVSGSGTSARKSEAKKSGKSAKVTNPI